MSKNEQHIYGIHAVAEALAAGTSIERIFLQKEKGSDKRMRMIKSHADEYLVPASFVPEVKLKQLSKGGNHQGAIAVISQISYFKLEELLEEIEGGENPPLLMMLDGVTDVRNFGAIARTASCMGVDAIIVPHRGAAATNADAMKTSAGALNHIKVARVAHIVDAIHLLQAYAIRVVAMTEKASESIYQQDLRHSTCLLLGSEEKGISPHALKRADTLTKIPLQGPIASLNVSVAAGMALAEVARQRG